MANEYAVIEVRDGHVHAQHLEPTYEVAVNCAQVLIAGLRRRMESTTTQQKIVFVVERDGVIVWKESVWTPQNP